MTDGVLTQADIAEALGYSLPREMSPAKIMSEFDQSLEAYRVSASRDGMTVKALRTDFKALIIEGRTDPVFYSVAFQQQVLPIASEVLEMVQLMKRGGERSECLEPSSAEVPSASAGV